MIKFDRLDLLQRQKKITICTGLIALILCAYTLVFILAAMVWNKLGKRKSVLAGIYGMIIAACIIFIPASGYKISDFALGYFENEDNLLHVDPVRISIAATYGIWFLYKSHLLNEGVEDWAVEEKNLQDRGLIPTGKFNYECREHMLLFGTTGAGKGVTINHMIKNAFETDQDLIIVSAKQASTDAYSQLEYTRRMAKKHGRKLYVVSMDSEVDDRCLYNPFKYVDRTEMQNALNSMIQSDSHFYKSNFVAWVLSIFMAIRAAGEEVTLDKILTLYEYKHYEAYVRRIAASGRIKFPMKYLTGKIKRYALNAENDSANLDLIFDAGQEVFDDSWERESISIRDAIKEHAVIYFDLNGVSAKAATNLIGACITAELQHVAREFKDPSKEKTVICDEASFYITDMFVSCFSLARSAGYKFIISTQGPEDLCDSQNGEKILSQLVNNSNQFGILRINSPKDADKAGEIIGTVMQAENTRRADGINYEGSGSIKPVPIMAANPNRIKNLRTREMIYYEKSDRGDHEPRPVMIHWRVDDL